MTDRGSSEQAPGTGTTNALSYEQARSELETVVQRLEAGGATLEESLALWERGEYLAGVCRSLLDQAQHRLERTTATAEDSGAGSAPQSE